MKENALERYTQAVAAVKEHTEANANVFDAHKKLMLNLIDRENELRDAVAESGEGVENALHKVKCEPQTQEFFDVEKTLQALRVTKEGAIAAGVYIVNQRPPRITISEVRA